MSAYLFIYIMNNINVLWSVVTFQRKVYTDILTNAIYQNF